MSESTESKTKALVVITGKQQKEIQQLVAIAPPAALVISTNVEYTEAGARLVQVKTNLKQLDAVQTDIAGPLANAMKDIKASVTKLAAFFDVPRKKLMQAEADIKLAMNTYIRAEEVKRAAAQKLLDDAAAKEKARIKGLADAAAEKARKEAAQAQAIADAALSAGRKAEYEKAKERQAKIESQASVKADIASAKIASLDAPVLATELPKAAGTTTRKTWVFEVYDETLIPREYLVLDEKKVRDAITAGERVITGLIIKQTSAIVGTGK